MREYSTPATVTVEARSGLADAVFDNAASHPDSAVFAVRDGDGWTDVTARQFADDVAALAGGLLALGLQPGDRVGLMARTRYEWTLVDYAVWTAGCVTVPVYETSSAEQVEWILGDSGAKAVVVETAAHAGTVASVRDRLPDLAEVLVVDDGGLDTLRQRGGEIARPAVDARREAVTADDLATIIYTSGTTGRPKGCELTHRNFLFNVGGAITEMREFFHDSGTTLLFLPLAHVLARYIQVGCVHARVRMGHAPDTTTLLADLGSLKPTFLLSVPRVFEKVYNGSKQKAHAGGKGGIFDRAEAVAIAWSEAQDTGGPGLGLRLQHALFDKLVYGKLRAAMGGNVTHAVSGGAPLGARLGHFYRGIGLVVLEGYGLTETTAPTTTNSPHAVRIGTVGRPIPGSAVKIADDGEILLAGDHVFRGYWHNEAATKESLEPDGWFHSGDLGSLDADGYLTITGRKKEIIVTAGGKNVAPAVLEDRLRAHPLVSQCLVVGDQRPFIGCLVTLDPDALPAWAERHGKTGTTAAELAEDPELRAEIQGAVDEANKAVSQAESIRQFRVLPVDFTEAGGQMTPSLKLKRQVILAQFADDVDALYRR